MTQKTAEEQNKELAKKIEEINQKVAENARLAATRSKTNNHEEVKVREESKIEATPVQKKEPEQVSLFAMKKSDTPKVDDEEGKLNGKVKNVE